MTLSTRISVLLTALAVLVVVPQADAARDPVAGGDTDLHMKKGMLRKLANNDVAVFGDGVGTVTGRKIQLPVHDGRLDPTNGEGYVDSRGGFRLDRGRHSVAITDLTVNTVRGAAFARIAGARMQLGAFLAPARSTREGFGASVRTAQLALTDKAARRISNRLGLRGGRQIKGGRVLSNVFSAVQPRTVTILPQGSATLAADAATLAKLEAKGVKAPAGVTAIAPATKSGPAAFQLPVAGGTLAPDLASGKVSMAGGVQILKQAQPYSPTLRLTGLEIDFAAKAASAALEILPTPPFPGAAGRPAIVDVAIPGNAVVANPTTRTIAIEGTALRLRQPFATTLNDVFNQPPPAPPSATDLAPGDSLGTLSVTVQAR